MKQDIHKILDAGRIFSEFKFSGDFTEEELWSMFASNECLQSDMALSVLYGPFAMMGWTFRFINSFVQGFYGEEK